MDTSSWKRVLYPFSKRALICEFRTHPQQNNEGECLFYCHKAASRLREFVQVKSSRFNSVRPVERVVKILHNVVQFIYISSQNSVKRLKGTVFQCTNQTLQQITFDVLVFSRKQCNVEYMGKNLSRK